VVQGGSGTFKIRVDPDGPVTLRLSASNSPGAAAFEDGSTELSLQRGGEVRVKGITASDLSGAMTLSAWSERASVPATTFIFDVLCATPTPRVFFGGRDVTDTIQNVVVGQEIALNVVLHPGLAIRSQSWSIGEPGTYTGGFVHTRLQGGPQPVILFAPSTHFYWVTAGFFRRVGYRVVFVNGENASAFVTFNVNGPSSAEVRVGGAQVTIAPAADPNSSVLGLAGSGITFHATYSLPEGMFENFTWVQLIESDSLMVKMKEGATHCVPASAPTAELGSGLDTAFPYGTRNPARDNPHIELSPEVQEFSRTFQARMYLLWTSGLSNSIAVPLGYVDWHFSAHAVRPNGRTNTWALSSSSGGPNDISAPFAQTHSYPMWSALVPYGGKLSCE
jgi:hypothetical protein